MVYNLKESNDTDINRKKNFHMDRLFLSVIPTYSITGVKALHVGHKQMGKSRHFKVILNNVVDVSSIVNKFNTDSAALVDPLFAPDKQSRDRTPHEIKHLQALNAEMEEQNARGETELTVKYVNNVPQIVKRQKRTCNFQRCTTKS